MEEIIMNGYQGKILKVDLSNRKACEEPLDEAFAKKYVGGVGFGVRWLYDTLQNGDDPLSPKAPLIFATGPLASINFLGSTGISVTAKSPLLGLIGDSDMRGRMGSSLKSCGYDALVIVGKADSPVYLRIAEGSCQILDGSLLWGKDIRETQELIHADPQNKNMLVTSIGVAGERLVKYATISCELQFFAGRTGTGAVMGSKNLKAIVLGGKQKTPVSDMDKVNELVKAISAQIQTDGTCDTLSKYGTWNTTGPANLNGILPTKNFQATTFSEIDKINGDAMLSTIYAKKRTCPGCPIGSRRVVEGETPYSLSPEFAGPQYETVASMGSLLLNGNPYAIAKANELCNLYGIDTISAGVTIAFAMECFDRGVLTEKDLGFKLNWGDPGGILKMIEMISLREGIGDVLAEGVKTASQKIGKGSEQWAMHVKGMEVPMHDPRGKKGMGLAYATSFKGADHESSMHDEAFQRENVFPELGLTVAMDRKQFEGKAALVKTLQEYWGVMADVVTICKFPMCPPRPLKPGPLVELLNAVTGWDFTVQDFVTTGERIFNLARLFNAREGMTRKDDLLPLRFEEVLKEGGSAGESYPRKELEKLLDEYYRLRGWSAEGIPTQETLKRLGLN
jgi:aldehyde:ferredoxin oxidoreductase